MTLRSALLVTSLLCLTACSKKEGAKGGGASSGAKKQASSDSKSGAGGSSDTSGGAGKKAASDSPDTVKIEQADQQRGGISVAPVEVRSMPQLLTVAGQVQMDEAHTSHVGAIADGPITAVYVLPGAIVKRGTVLAQLHSHSVHETVSALLQAYAAADRQRGAVTFAQQAVDRYGHLFTIQAASLEERQQAEQGLLQANQNLIDAQANVRMEREHLSELLQVRPESLTPDHLYDRELIPIRSPIDGVVIARNVTVGQVLAIGTEAFTVSNLSTVWVTAAVNEKDLALVYNGASADVVTQGYADRDFRGRVGMVGSTLDPQTRTIPVRIVVPNAGTLLRPGMFATVHIAGLKTRQAVFINEDALQDINGMQVAFVTADGTTFRAQAVRLGTRSQGRAEVVEGLKSGDHVVTQGAFMLKSELLKGTMGDG